MYGIDINEIFCSWNLVLSLIIPRIHLFIKRKYLHYLTKNIVWI